MTLRHRTRRLRHLTAGASIIGLLGAAAAAADVVGVQTSRSGDRARIVFTWPAEVGFETDTGDGRLTIRFDRSIEGDFSSLKALPEVNGLAVVGPDGRSVVLPLQRGVSGLAFAVDSTVVVELSHPAPARREPAAAPAPPIAPSPASPAASPSAGAGKAEPEAASGPPPVVVRTGQHKGFSRVVFEWPIPVAYTLERTADGLDVSFDHPGRIDASDFSRPYLSYVTGGASDIQGEQTRASLRLREGARVRDYREGRKVVIDVMAPPPAPPPVPPPAAPPAPTPATAAGSPAAPPVAAVPPPAPPPPAKAQTTPAREPPATPAGPSPREAPPLPPPLPPPAAPATSATTAGLAAPGTVRFAWDRPAAAALFRRGSTFWCVFDQPSRQDGSTLRRQAGATVRSIEQLPDENATVIRLSPADGIEPYLDRDDAAWVLHTAARAAEAAAGRKDEAITPVPDGPPGGMRLLLPTTGPAAPLAIADPSAGSTLVVVPVPTPGARLTRAYGYPQVRILPTLQGVAIEPLADGINVRSTPKAVVIGLPGGLAVSQPAAPAAAAAPADPPPPPSNRLLDPAGWQTVPTAGFAARRQALERRAADSTGEERERNRLQLAQFLLGQGFAAEALGPLALVAEDRPTATNEPAFLLMRGAARLLRGRLAEARDDLERAAADPAAPPEPRPWAAVARFASGGPPGDLSGLDQWVPIVASYPPAVRRALGVPLAEAAITGGKSKDARPLLDAVKRDAASSEERAEVAYLEGLASKAAGDSDGALALWEQAAASDARRPRARAELARTLLLHEKGKLKPEEAIAALDRLRAVWRGDETEFRVLRELGRLHLQAGNYAASLRTLRQAVSAFPSSPQAPEATRDMAQAFEHLYLGGGADQLPPVEALALYDEFKELTPPGAKGDETVRKLAERLVTVDLLDRAAGLLNGLMPSTADPAARAAIAARMAEIRLLDSKPQEALDALRGSTANGLPADLQQRRALTQARALMALGRGDEAVAALAGSRSVDADLLRAQVYRSRSDWGQVAGALGRVVEATRMEPAAALDERQAREILDLAVALTLSGSDVELAKLDEQYRSRMSATPLRDAFRLIAGTTPPPDADAAALAELLQKALAFRQEMQKGAAKPASEPAR